jgi:hypothetical protein
MPSLIQIPMQSYRDIIETSRHTGKLNKRFVQRYQYDNGLKVMFAYGTNNRYPNTSGPVLSICNAYGRPFRYSCITSVSQSVSKSIRQSVNQSVTQSESLSQSDRQSVSHSIRQSESLSQSVSQSIDGSML